jgi:hypothetical protein
VNHDHERPRPRSPHPNPAAAGSERTWLAHAPLSLIVSPKGAANGAQAIEHHHVVSVRFHEPVRLAHQGLSLYPPFLFDVPAMAKPEITFRTKPTSPLHPWMRAVHNWWFPPPTPPSPIPNSKVPSHSHVCQLHKSTPQSRHSKLILTHHPATVEHGRILVLAVISRVTKVTVLVWLLGWIGAWQGSGRGEVECV